MSRTWYSYIGAPGGELNSANYQLTDVSPTCLEGSSNICAVYGRSIPENYGSNPAPFRANLIRYIATAKATSLSQPIGIGVQKYVYTYPGGL